MNDLEGALALISNLDLVITASTAPCSVPVHLVLTLLYTHHLTYLLMEDGKNLQCAHSSQMQEVLTDDASNDPDLVEDITKQIVSILN